MPELPKDVSDEAIGGYLEAVAGETMESIGLPRETRFEDLDIDQTRHFVSGLSDRINRQLEHSESRDAVRAAIVKLIEGEPDPSLFDVKMRLEGRAFDFDEYLESLQKSGYGYSAVNGLLGKAPYLIAHVSVDKVFGACKRLVDGELAGMDSGEDAYYIVTIFAETFEKVKKTFGDERAMELRDALYARQLVVGKIFDYGLTMREVFDETQIAAMAKRAETLRFRNVAALEDLLQHLGLATLCAAKKIDSLGEFDEISTLLAGHFGEGHDEELARLVAGERHYLYGPPLKAALEAIDSKVAAEARPAVWAKLFEGGHASEEEAISGDGEYNQVALLGFLMDRTFETGEAYYIRHRILDCARMYTPDRFLALLEKCSGIAVKNWHDRVIDYEEILKAASEANRQITLTFAIDKNHFDRLPAEAVSYFLAGENPEEKTLEILAWSNALASGQGGEFWERVFSAPMPVADKLHLLQFGKQVDLALFWRHIASGLEPAELKKKVVALGASFDKRSVSDQINFFEAMPKENRALCKEIFLEMVKAPLSLQVFRHIYSNAGPWLKGLVFELSIDGLMPGENGAVTDHVKGLSLDDAEKAYDRGEFTEVTEADALKILKNDPQKRSYPFCYKILHGAKDSSEYSELIKWLYAKLVTGEAGVTEVQFADRADWYFGRSKEMKSEKAKWMFGEGPLAMLIAEATVFERFKAAVTAISEMQDPDQGKFVSSFNLGSFGGVEHLATIEEGLALSREVGSVEGALKVSEWRGLYQDKPAIRSGFVEIAKNYGVGALDVLVELLALYKTSEEKFLQVKGRLAELCRTGKAYQALRASKDCFKEDIPCFEYFCELLENGKEKQVRDFTAHNQKIYQGRLPRFKLGEYFSEKYGERPARLTAAYVETAEVDGRERADEIIDRFMLELPGLKLRTIGAEPDKELRKHPFYLALLEEVFGQDTRYTNIERNIGAGDSAEDRYAGRVLPEGRRTDLVIRESAGYRVKDEATEGTTALKDYSERVKGVADFVRARNSDKDKLKKDYDKKVSEFFEATVMAAHLEGELSVQEKLLVVLLDQGLKRQRRDEVLDLLVLYKFVYEHDIEDFVNETAERVKAGGDEVSQRFQQWVELQEVYGENLKHSLEHEIFPGVPKEKAGAISEVYLGLVLAADEEFIDQKSAAKLEAILGNDKLPLENLPRAISSNLVGYYTRGLAPEVQGKLRPQIGQKVEDYFRERPGTRPTLEDLNSMLQDLRKMYLEARFDPEFQVSELAKADYNRITQEVAKYEENVASEASAKRIEGYFAMSQESTNARMTAALCIGEDPEMYKNPNYFEFVLKEGETGECLGLSMFLDIKMADGKKYLYFAPNPSQACLEKYSESEVFKYLKKVALDFAKANDYDGVVIPADEAAIYGSCTNRGGKFLQLLKKSRLKDKDGFKSVKFDQKEWLSQGRFKYGYEAGALIWER
ncbi:hypothetical protein HY605_05995 [Candidatus Peregrinibacteria bacterium]|nr:hypothetical protein [Candidatus Peregrinibacteria bacterium]